MWQDVDMTKRPRDPNELAKLIVNIATGEAEDTVSESKRNPSKRRAGGLKGGKKQSRTSHAASNAKILRDWRLRRDGKSAVRQPRPSAAAVSGPAARLRPPYNP